MMIVMTMMKVMRRKWRSRTRKEGEGGREGEK